MGMNYGPCGLHVLFSGKQYLFSTSKGKKIKLALSKVSSMSHERVRTACVGLSAWREGAIMIM